MKILHLTLKKKWFDMIASGEKKEEYRDIKDYWKIRLIGKSYDAILFSNGYRSDRPQVLIEYGGVCSGLGIIEWGAPPEKEVYILKLGEILNLNNTKYIITNTEGSKNILITKANITIK